MLYKTIVHKLLQERPALYESLRRKRQLPRTLNRLATDLKTSHESWKEQLSRTRPGSDPSQIASSAGELALQDLLEALPPESPPDDSETLSLDQAMAFISRPMPPG